MPRGSLFAGQPLLEQDQGRAVLQMTERGALVKSRPMLVASDQETRCAIEDAKFSKRSVLLVIGKRSLPHLLEATLIPAVLFWVMLNTLGAGAAMIDSTVRITVRVVVTAIFTILAFVLVWEVRGPLVWVVIAGLLATALSAPVPTRIVRAGNFS